VRHSPIFRGEARRQLQIASHLHVVLFFGYIKRYKGLDVLLKSLPLLKQLASPILCLIAGQCLQSRRRYISLIAGLHVQNEVRWFDGYIPERSMPLYFAASDVVALPYLQASASGVLLSAYAYGKAVVASEAGSNPELVEHGLSGLLVPTGDPKALAEALAQILLDPELAARMGARCREIVAARHSWADIAERTEEVYLQLWSRSKEGS